MNPTTEELNEGDTCPECKEGKVVVKVVRFQTRYEPTEYEWSCNQCNERFD